MALLPSKQTAAWFGEENTISAMVNIAINCFGVPITKFGCMICFDWKQPATFLRHPLCATSNENGAVILATVT